MCVQPSRAGLAQASESSFWWFLRCVTQVRLIYSAVRVAGAWILTGGTHAGVMKHVGMAVRDYTLSSGLMEGQIVVIGVAPWGAIHNRHALVHPEVRWFHNQNICAKILSSSFNNLTTEFSGIFSRVVSLRTTLWTSRVRVISPVSISITLTSCWWMTALTDIMALRLSCGHVWRNSSLSSRWETEVAWQDTHHLK